MAFSYPQYHGQKDEDVEDFLEKMEVACISNQIQAPAEALRLLQLCLKGDARAWLKAYEAKLQTFDPPVALNLEGLREALVEEFVKSEDPDRVWQEVQRLVQSENEPIEAYIKKFASLWEDMCKALQPQVPPPDMMKKDKFVAGLKNTLC